ncbi:MAG: repeat-containing protein [Candidatus Poribacteria bacterium]|nr:repeat-containing protein [Candidatus Poribacteria bacterium]
MISIEYKLNMAIIKFSFIITILLSTFLTPLLPQVEGAENNIDDGVKYIAESLKKDLSITDGRQIKIALFPFNWDKSDQWALCRIAYEILLTQFSKTAGISLIDRNVTQQALKNLKSESEKGLLKAEDVSKLGTLLGSDFIITGHISDLITIININVFLWDANTGNLLSTKSVQIRKTSAITAMIANNTKSDSSEPYSVKWQSKPAPYRILGIAVCDFDRDGINDLIIVTESEFKVMSWDGFCFVDRASVQYVNVTQLKRNQWDIRTIFGFSEDGKNEVYISVPDVETSIWKWDKDAPIKVDSIDPTLLSIQKDSMIFGALKVGRNYFVGQKTYRISRTDNKKSEKLIPKDFYSIVLGDVNGVEGKEWLIVDVDNTMDIYSDDMSLIWQSVMKFGSGITIADLDNNGKNEIIGTSAMPQNRKDSLIILEWDGNTYTKKWESQPINGYITAICIGDPNNDGVDELVTVVYGHNGSEISLYSANQ